jgi:hypothetical protein
MLVLTDIEADPDDTQSLVRLLLYSNLIEIQGLVATTSVHMKDRVNPDSIRKVIEAYGKVQPSLLLHEPGFPTAENLLGLVTQGRPEYGMKGVGEGKDTPGSERIIELLEADDERPLWISVWGGPNTLAQALYRIRETRDAEEAIRLIRKLRVYTISDQDDSGTWMRRKFPNLFYIVSPGRYEKSIWISINSVIEGIDNTTISNDWLARNIQQGHGPLGVAYPDVAWGMEGDTPAYLALIPVGLAVPDRPDWGGWGGRYELYQPTPEEIEVGREVQGGIPIEAETRPIWANAVDTYVPRVDQEYGRTLRTGERELEGSKPTLWRWRDHFQHDFAARMDWCVSAYTDANHPPVPSLAHPTQLTVQSGARFTLDASGTTDPDGDSLVYLWTQYPEAGSGPTIDVGNSPENVYFLTRVAPEVSKPETLHFILQVSDRGSPPLTRYQRVIVTVEPNEDAGTPADYPPGPPT